MKTRLAGLFLVLIAVVLAMVSCQASRMGYESAPYSAVRTEGAFEVRDYPALTVVETAMSNQSADGSFGRLFSFITGRNATQQKISMTTPVFMSDSGPVRTMAFVMPASLGAGKVPAPTDGALSVRELPAGRFAVLRFRGGRSPAKEQESLERLKAWLATQRLPVSSDPVYAYFDPPWTPPFLRRNEVMLRIDSGQ
jgi:DNA gyrase inhibitor GyrI